MKKVIYISFLILFNFQFSSYAQNIYSALHHDEKPKFRKCENVKKILKHVTFFNNDGTEIEKSTIFYNDSCRVLKEDRFNEKYNRKTRLTFQYDSTQVKSLKRRLDISQPYVKSSNTSSYEYNEKGHLIKKTDRNNNKIFRITNISNNEIGHPIEVIVIENSIFYGKETAEYDYDKNIMTRTVFNNQGKVISRKNGQINFNKSIDSDLRNEYGDLIQSKLFKFEYKYDKFGNWKKQTRHMLKNKKWVKNAIFKRIITYRK